MNEKEIIQGTNFLSPHGIEELEECNLVLPDLIDMKINDAAVSKQHLLKCNYKALVNLSEAELFVFLVDFSRQLKFSPDKDVISCFKILGLKKSELRWFIPIKEIIDEFKVIEQSGIKINKIAALYFIELHLDIKIAVEIYKRFTDVVTDDRVNMNSATKKYKQVLDRRKNGIKLTTQFDEIAEMLEKAAPEAPTKVFTKIFEGKTEYMELRLMFDNFFFPNPNISNRKFRITIYELCRIIMKDFKRKLPDYTSYLNLKDPSEPTWDGYRAKQIKTHIYKR